MRTEEGDDLSGVLRDETGRVRMRYYRLAHGGQVQDACAERPERLWARDSLVGGVAFRYCELSDRAGHQCFSFSGQANICTDSASMDPFVPIDLVRTLRRPDQPK